MFFKGVKIVHVRVLECASGLDVEYNKFANPIMHLSHILKSTSHFPQYTTQNRKKMHMYFCSELCIVGMGQAHCGICEASLFRNHTKSRENWFGKNWTDVDSWDRCILYNSLSWQLHYQSRAIEALSQDFCELIKCFRPSRYQFYSYKQLLIIFITCSPAKCPVR